jgi:hypothetical protein
MAWRAEGPVFSETTNVTVCVPLPLAVLTTIHDSVDAAVHGHWASVAVILSSKVPPNAPTLYEGGSAAMVQSIPACMIVSGWPSMRSAPCRGLTPGFGWTVYVTDPTPTPSP